MPICALVIAHLLYFKILQTNIILASKLVHVHSTTNIEWNELKTTLSWALEVKG